MSRTRINNFKRPKTSITHVKRPKTVILGLFWPQREPRLPSYFAQKFENHPNFFFEYSQMPLLTFYDDRIILQTVLNTEGQHANVTNVLRFSCYS